METLKEYLRTYWLNLIAFGLFLVPVVRTVAAGNWLDLLPLPILGFVGLIFFTANELVSEMMPEAPHLRFEGLQILQSPLFVKIGGAAMLIAAAYGTFVI